MNMSMGKFVTLMFGVGFVGAGESLLLVHYGHAPSNLFRLGLTLIIPGVVACVVAIWGCIVIDKMLRR